MMGITELENYESFSVLSLISIHFVQQLPAIVKAIPTFEFYSRDCLSDAVHPLSPLCNRSNFLENLVTAANTHFRICNIPCLNRHAQALHPSFQFRSFLEVESSPHIFAAEIGAVRQFAKARDRRGKEGKRNKSFGGQYTHGLGRASTGN